jgi:hypothetical protein
MGSLTPVSRFLLWESLSFTSPPPAFFLFILQRRSQHGGLQPLHSFPLDSRRRRCCRHHVTSKLTDWNSAMSLFVQNLPYSVYTATRTPTPSFTNLPAGYDTQFYSVPGYSSGPNWIGTPFTSLCSTLGLVILFHQNLKQPKKKIRTKMRRAMPRERKRERTPTKYRVQSILSFNLIFHYLM